jgi:hypothetical protein
MSENNEKFVLEDGRKAEKIVTESKISDQESQKVIEIKVEETRPLKTQTKITEKTRCYIYERITETVDQETGRVLESKVENFDCNTGEAKELVLNEQALTPNKLKLNSCNLNSCSEENQTKFDLKGLLLTAIIVAQVAALVYLLFFSK